jgi:hypothetical protein
MLCTPKKRPLIKRPLERKPLEGRGSSRAKTKGMEGKLLKLFGYKQLVNLIIG